MQKPYDGVKAQAMLDRFEQDGGINPGCYFATVADNLLGRFGERAIEIAAGALQKMRLLEDHDGRVLWEGVSTQIWARISAGADRLPDLEDGASGREPMPLLH